MHSVRPSLRSPSTLAALSALALSPALASAAADPADLLVAMEIPPNLIADGPFTPNSSPTMFDVRSNLGVITPTNPPTMALMSTGNVDNITQQIDYDHPPGGVDTGDRATLEIDLAVPAYANSFAFDFNFLSREYPQFVGQEYNDTFEVWLDSQSYQGQIVFDAFGNPVTVNNALFTVTAPADLAGTGFEGSGATGWVTTISPCTPSEVMSLTFVIYDVADGIFDSAVLLDNLRFSEETPDGPWTGKPTPDNPIAVHFASPKEGPLAGGNAVTLRGANFVPTMSLRVGDAEIVDFTVGPSGESVTIDSMPPSVDAGAGAEGGPVHVVVSLGLEEVTLRDGYTYWEGADGLIPPRVTRIVPSSAHPAGGTDVRVRGQGFAPGASVWFLMDDGETVIDAEGDVQVVQDIEGGTEIILRTPEMPQGWAEVLVTNPDGVSSTPGYPFHFTTTAQDPGGQRETPSGRGCSQSPYGSGGWMAVLLLGLLGATRRRPRWPTSGRRRG